MVGSNDLNKSAKFYDAVFVPLDIKKIKTTEKYIGYAQKNNLSREYASPVLFIVYFII